jgi:hypothetical protein
MNGALTLVDWHGHTVTPYSGTVPTLRRDGEPNVQARSTAATSSAHATRKATPPTGVSAPSQRSTSPTASRPRA